MKFRVTRGKYCVGWLEEVNYGSIWRLIRHMRWEKKIDRREKLQNKARLPTYLSLSNSMQPPSCNKNKSKDTM